MYSLLSSLHFGATHCAFICAIYAIFFAFEKFRIYFTNLFLLFHFHFCCNFVLFFWAFAYFHKFYSSGRSSSWEISIELRMKYALLAKQLAHAALQHAHQSGMTHFFHSCFLQTCMQAAAELQICVTEILLKIKKGMRFLQAFAACNGGALHNSPSVFTNFLQREIHL